MRSINKVSIALFLLLLGISVSRSQAAAVLVSSAANSLKSASTTLLIAVPSGGWAAGSSVIVHIAANILPSSVTDDVGNTYANDSQGATQLLYSANNISALSAGQNVKVTFGSSFSAAAAVAADFTGLTSSPFDVSGDGSGSSINPTAGPTANTSQASELIIGIVKVNGPGGDTFTPKGDGLGGTYTLINRASTTGAGGTTNYTANLMYEVVSVIGQYKATSTLGTSRAWNAEVATYKVSPATAGAARVVISKAVAVLRKALIYIK